MKPPRPTPGPHPPPGPSEGEMPRSKHAPVHTAASMEVAPLLAELCEVEPCDLGIEPTRKWAAWHFRRRQLARWLAEEADLRAICAGLERELRVLHAKVSHLLPESQERSLRGEIALMARQLRRCLALLGQPPSSLTRY